MLHLQSLTWKLKIGHGTIIFSFHVKLQGTLISKVYLSHDDESVKKKCLKTTTPDFKFVGSKVRLEKGKPLDVPKKVASSNQ